MSEFSSSYHLHSATQDDAVALLECSQCQGFAFSTSGQWSTFLASGQPLTVNPQVTAANEGTMLYYWSAEDHGWGFSLFEGTDLITRFECDWEEEEPAIVTESDLDAVIRLIPSDASQSEKKNSLRDILSSDDAEADEEESAAYRFARLLGLEYFSWLSYDNWLAEFRAGRGPYPGVAVGHQQPPAAEQTPPRLVTSVSGGCESPQGESAATMDEELVGTWLVVAVEMAGKKRQLHAIAHNQFYEFTMDGRCIITNKREKTKSEKRFLVDPLATPKHLDRISKDDVVEKGIYKIEGNELCWCYQLYWYAELGNELAERPSSFSTGADRKTALKIMQRVPET